MRSKDAARMDQGMRRQVAFTSLSDAAMGEEGKKMTKVTVAHDIDQWIPSKEQRAAFV